MEYAGMIMQAEDPVRMQILFYYRRIRGKANFKNVITGITKNGTLGRNGEPDGASVYGTCFKKN